MSNNNTKNLNLSSLLDSTMKEVLKEKVEFILQEEIKLFLFSGIVSSFSQRVFKGYSKRYKK